MLVYILIINSNIILIKIIMYMYVYQFIKYYYNTKIVIIKLYYYNI